MSGICLAVLNFLSIVVNKGNGSLFCRGADSFGFR